MKNILTIVIGLLIISGVQAQKTLKYKRVYEVVKEGNREKSYSLLLAYQKQDPEFANSYFQLALIAEYWAKDYDPLTDPRLVRFFAYNTRLYYGLANLRLQKESKSNREYYENGNIPVSGKKLSMEEIIAFVDKKSKEMVEYEKNINEITSYFEKTVEYYNFCVKEFKDINAKYAKVKNIYLSEEAELQAKLTAIQNSFDSSLVYFNKYRKTLDRFPIKNYNQHYKLRPIITYRLDGLTQSNFLKNDISLWDYGAWVKNVKDTQNGDIKQNRNQINRINTDLDNKIKSLKKEIYSDDLSPYVLDEKFIYKIEKYDPQSLLAALFKYKESETKFLVDFRKEINAKKQDEPVSLKKHSFYILDLIAEKQHADSLIAVATGRISPINIRKYKNFYLAEYNGMTGLKKYLKNQTKFLNNYTDIAYERCRKNLFMNLIPTMPKNFTLDYKGKTITSKKQLNSYFAQNIIQDKTAYWLSGSESKENGTQDFIARTNPDSTIQFLKSLSKKPKSNVVFTDIYEDIALSCVQISDDNPQIQIYKTDNKGISKSIIKINSPLHPVYFSYDGLNDEISLILGTSSRYENSNRFEVYRFSSDAKELPAPTVLNIQGNIFDALKTDDNLIIFANFRTYTDDKGKTHTADNQRNILINTITSNGDLIQKDIKANLSLVGLKAVKLSSNNIIICGSKSEHISNLKALADKPLFFMQTDKKNQIIYKNWHD